MEYEPFTQEKCRIERAQSLNLMKSVLSTDRPADAVVARLDMGRQLAPQGFVVQIRVHVGEDRALGLEALDPAERICNAPVARMRLVAQCVDHPNVQPGECRRARGGQAAQIAGIA